MNIGKLVATLAANAKPMIEQLDRAKLASKGLANSIVIDRAREVQSMVKAADAVKSSGMGAGLSALAGQARQLSSAFLDAVDAAIETADKARYLGVSVAELQGAIVWSGKSAQEMTAALTVTQGVLNGMAAGSLDAARQVSNLAAVSGTTVEQLQSGGWAAVYDAIGRIADPAQQAAQAFRYLGSDATKFLDALRGGGALGAGDLGKRLGLGVDAADLENMRKVVETVGYLKAIMQGIQNQVMLGVAPIVAELAKSFDKVKVNLGWVRDAVIDVAQNLALAGVAVYSVVTNTKAAQTAFDLLKSMAEMVGLAFESAMLGAIARITKGLNPLRAAIDGIAGQGTSDALAIVGGAFGGLPGRMGGMALGSSLDLEAIKAQQASLEAARKVAEAAAALQKLTVNSDPGKAVVEFFGRIRKRFEDVKNIPKPPPLQTIDLYVRRFQELAASVRTPLGAFRQSANDLATFRQLGLLQGAGGRTGALSAYKSLMDLRSAVGTADPRVAGAAEANTREAYSAIVQYQMQGRAGDIQQQIRDAIREGLIAEKEQLRIGKVVADNLAAILAEMRKEEQ